MTTYRMISTRDVDGRGFGSRHAPLSFWMAASGTVDLREFSSWKPVAPEDFKKDLLQAADAFPRFDDPEEHEEQRHVTIFVHGYNNDWKDAARRYQALCKGLFGGDKGLGLCILFSWPSNGSPVDYLPDRADARESAPDLAQVLCEFYDWLARKQRECLKNPKKACRAKTSIIAHSMGNYLLQKAMQSVWTRNNQPLLVSLVNQLLMVAADVDNDLFASGETIGKTDGDAIANLTYRITALYSGRDNVLGLSAGLKHFGKRRLGRSGLDRSVPCSDNVWDVDCSGHFPEKEKHVHSAYFDQPETLDLMNQILRGTDRRVIART